MSHSQKKLEAISLEPSTPLKLFVWRIRRSLRDILNLDILDHHDGQSRKTSKARKIYLKVDDFIARYLPGIQKEINFKVARKRVFDTLVHDLGYELKEVNESKPWGAYYRIVDEQADRFLEDFFPGLSKNEATLGRSDVVLSPKILLVYPGRRLSWQYHNRRAERWRFMTAGHYYRSHSDSQGEKLLALGGQEIQFAVGERHRLCAAKSGYTVVAEIWQHNEAGHPSTERDIVRLADDYHRGTTA